MKAHVLSLEGKIIKDVELPKQFEEEFRPDLIRKAVLAIQCNRRQPYGAKPEAGKRACAVLSKRRRKYRGCYGRGISRTPRKILARHGSRFHWQAAFVPFAVGGRRAHPPKSEKIWKSKMNVKERRKAIRSCIAATGMPELVKRYCDVKNVPILVEAGIESIDKTKPVLDFIKKIAPGALDKLKKKKIRAGKGKLRGRKYKKKIFALFVVGDKCKLQKAVRNIPGSKAVIVDKLNAELLAPGTTAGRFVIWSENAIEKLRGGLFI